jgi:hypothetical protein
MFRDPETKGRLMQNPAGGEGAKKFQEAETDVEQSKTNELLKEVDIHSRGKWRP